MVLATWWSEDGEPVIEPVRGLTVECPSDDRGLASIAALPISEVWLRRSEGHRPYVARVAGEPAGYGWVATESASIGELGLTFQIPRENLYLWDFATLPSFRGQGVYPALLSEIVRRECPPAGRLWIIHAPENLPSGIGMSRAGFQPVAELSFDSEGRPALAPLTHGIRALAASALFGLPLVHEALDPCWACEGACDHDSSDASAACECAIHTKR